MNFFVGVSETKILGVSKRAVKESQKEKMGQPPLDDGNGNALFEYQNDYKLQRKQQELPGGSLIFVENICFALPAQEYNGAGQR